MTLVYPCNAELLSERRNALVSFDLADPRVMLYAWTALIVTFALLDAPAIAAAARFVRLKRRLSRNRSLQYSSTR